MAVPGNPEGKCMDISDILGWPQTPSNSKFLGLFHQRQPSGFQQLESLHFESR